MKSPRCFALLLVVMGWLAATPLARAGPASRPTTLPFENQIEAFEAADRRQMPPANATLFIGSSSIRFWTTLAQDFPDFPVINRGFGGSTIDDCRNFVDRIVVPYHPKRIVFYAGDNDLAFGKSPQAVADDFKNFVVKVRIGLPDTPIYFISIKPSILRWNIVNRIREANRLIQAEIASDPSLHYINVFDAMLGDDGTPRKDLFRFDGLHMNRRGYELWTSIITPMLK